MTEIVAAATAEFLYVLGVAEIGGTGSTIRAWRPNVPGVSEVFHAHFVDHAYPMHTHDSWDLMVLDRGAVRFNLDRHDYGNGESDRVILLPPGVPHDGRTVNAVGFRKRVIYLDTTVLPLSLVGAAVDTPIHHDGALRARLSALHECAAESGREWEAESRLAFVRERLLQRLRAAAPSRIDTARAPSQRLAESLRALLDASIGGGLTLAEASRRLEAEPTHLVRSFSRAFGIPPHRYLVGRRVERARRLLLDGVPAAEAAAMAGFYDQAHMHRHFVRFLATTPGAYAQSTRDRSGRDGGPTARSR